MNLFKYRADLLAALIYACLAALSFSALANYTSAHTLPNGEPMFPWWGGAALAIAVDGSVLYAFISFKRAPWLAGALLASGAVATYMLQRWHAQGALHPLWVAGVVPALMVLVTVAWHRIRSSAEPAPTISTPAPISAEPQHVSAESLSKRARAERAYADLSADGSPVSAVELAAAADLSASYARSLVNQFAGNGHRPGSGS